MKKRKRRRCRQVESRNQWSMVIYRNQFIFKLETESGFQNFDFISHHGIKSTGSRSSERTRKRRKKEDKKKEQKKKRSSRRRRTRRIDWISKQRAIFAKKSCA